jgi:hypothetical protein
MHKRKILPVTTGVEMAKKNGIIAEEDRMMAAAMEIILTADNQEENEIQKDGLPRGSTEAAAGKEG